MDEFNRNANAVNVASKMTGYVSDLLAEPVAIDFTGPKFNEFDVLTVSMALHHFEDPDMALQKLAKRLKNGGVCYIIDLVPQPGTVHDHGHGHAHSHGHGHGHSHDEHAKHQHEFGDAAHTVKTHGFSKEDMQKLFQGAGLSVKFDYEVLPEPLVFNKEGKTFEKTAFIARAQLA